MGQSLPLALYQGDSTSVALGFFDGFHRGHQAIVSQAEVAFTFSNHPATVVDSRRAPRLITTFQERVERLLGAGVTVVWTEFDRPFSQIEPDQFVSSILVERLRARKVVVGANYRYGHRAAGDVASLQQAGQRHGFEVVVVEAVEDGGEIISSTRIRGCIEAGAMEAARRLMGASYSVSAIVQRGAARGRTIGVPTANLAIPQDKVVPPHGVYAVWAVRGGRNWAGVANLGVRPTFGEQNEPSLEVHILEGEHDIYGELLEVQFVERLREERKFAGLEELKTQIGRDIEAARQTLA